MASDWQQGADERLQHMVEGPAREALVALATEYLNGGLPAWNLSEGLRQIADECLKQAVLAHHGPEAGSIALSQVRELRSRTGAPFKA